MTLTIGSFRQDTPFRYGTPFQRTTNLAISVADLKIDLPNILSVAEILTKKIYKAVIF